MASSGPISELGGRTWAELEAKRHPNGQLMFPDVLRRRSERGEVEETKVRLRVPSPEDEIEARVDAIAWFSKKKLARDDNKDLFDNVEQMCLLARAIRTHEEPHAQYADPEELARFDEASLHDLLERLNGYKALLEVRAEDLSEEKFWRVVLAVGRTASVLPLTDIAGRAQASFVVRMAKEALLSPRAKSFAPSSETSTPAP